MVVTSGIVETDDMDPLKTVIVARLDPSTINTGVSVRDDHLRSVDFFDIQRYPEIVFQSTAISQTAKDQYAVVGTLSMRGMERAVTLHARAAGDGIDPFGNRRAGASAQTTLNRKDFGLEWNRALESGGFLVGDEVEINLEIEAVMDQAAQDAAA
jgi:polyisoprenoid-binding protein YceI